MASEGLNFPSEPRSFFRIREPIFSGLQLHGGQRISNNPAPSFAALMYSPVGLLEVSCLSLSLSLSPFFSRAGKAANFVRSVSQAVEKSRLMGKIAKVTPEKKFRRGRLSSFVAAPFAIAKLH